MIAILAVLFVILAIYIFFILYIFFPVIKIYKLFNIIVSGEINLPTKANQHFLIKKVMRTLSKLKASSDREHISELLKKQAEFAELQSQINPHFLYNTLESIRGEALKQKVPEIASMTEALANFFRYSISKNRNLVSLHDELQNVKNYFEILQYRFDNRFSLVVDLDGEDDSILDFKLPRLTIQPIIENSIYHGLETKMGKGRIVIKIIITQVMLLINISDDGIGMDKQRLDKLNLVFNDSTLDFNYYANENNSNSGIALINVNRRIKLYFGNEYGLSMKSILDVGTEVDITLPLVNN